MDRHPNSTQLGTRSVNPSANANGGIKTAAIGVMTCADAPTPGDSTYPYPFGVDSSPAPFVSPFTVPLTASYRSVRRGGGESATSAGAIPGNERRTTADTPIWPANHGSDETKTCSANGQLWCPGVAITAHVMPFALPRAHEAFAASA